MSTITLAMEPSTREVSYTTCEANDNGLNSPQIGRQMFVPFSSKKNPSEQLRSRGLGAVWLSKFDITFELGGANDELFPVINIYHFN